MITATIISPCTSPGFYPAEAVIGGDSINVGSNPAKGANELQTI